MQQIFIKDDPIDGKFRIEGDDAHHLANVVRLKIGEKIRVSTASEESYLCSVVEVTSTELVVQVEDKMDSTELPCKIYLFQAIPKGDRMETIIEKCVELGVTEIIPVEMKNCVVKLDAKKKASRVLRWQAIADSAAKQSKRSAKPVVSEVMSFADAIKRMNECDIKLAPYESKNGMEDTKNAFKRIASGNSISIIIGPEGGFAPEEIDECSKTMDIISLGKRILRTDTAAICTLSMLMAYIETCLE